MSRHIFKVLTLHRPASSHHFSTTYGLQMRRHTYSDNALKDNLINSPCLWSAQICEFFQISEMVINGWLKQTNKYFWRACLGNKEVTVLCFTDENCFLLADTCISFSYNKTLVLCDEASGSCGSHVRYLSNISIAALWVYGTRYGTIRLIQMFTHDLLNRFTHDFLNRFTHNFLNRLPTNLKINWFTHLCVNTA